MVQFSENIISGSSALARARSQSTLLGSRCRHTHRWRRISRRRASARQGSVAARLLASTAAADARIGARLRALHGVRLIACMFPAIAGAAQARDCASFFPPQAATSRARAGRLYLLAGVLTDRRSRRDCCRRSARRTGHLDTHHVAAGCESRARLTSVCTAGECGCLTTPFPPVREKPRWRCAWRSASCDRDMPYSGLEEGRREQPQLSNGALGK